MKVVINTCYGGFELSNTALNLYNEKRKKLDLQPYTWSYNIQRNDLLLIEVIEELGNDANADYSKLEIVIIPTEYKDYYEIEECEGIESIAYDFCGLIKSKFINVDIDTLSGSQCRKFLKEIKDLAYK
jgi:hypothetical protein